MFKQEVVTILGVIINQFNKLTKSFYLHLRYVNIGYFLKSQLPMCHRQFFKVIPQNGENVENFCNDMENRFHFACQKWFNQLN